MSAFRLDVVLRLRRLAEDAARVRLATSLAAHREAVATGESLRAAASAELQRLVHLQVVGSPAGALRDAHDAVEHAERAVLAGLDRIEAAGRGLLEARSALADATRRREVVERLRERGREAERRAADRREVIALSEMATLRHAWTEIEEALR